MHIFPAAGTSKRYISARTAFNLRDRYTLNGFGFNIEPFGQDQHTCSAGFVATSVLRGLEHLVHGSA